MIEFLMLFTSQEPAGLVVTALIAALLALAIVDVARADIYLVTQLQLLVRARRRLASGEAVVSMDADATLATLDLPPESLVGARILRVLQLRRAGLGQREVLGRISLEAITGRGAMARYIATILTLLGLVGTVVGMSVSMFRITAAFKNVDNVRALAELTQALSGTLEGMKTAFACTLAGLLGAVVVSALNHRIRRRQSTLVQDLEAFVACELLPRLEAVDPDADQAAKAFASVLVTTSDRLAQLGERLAGAAERYESGSSHLAAAAETLATGAHSSFAALAEAVRDLRGGTEQLAAHQGTAIQTVGGVRDAVAALSHTMEAELRRLNEFAERSSQLLAERLGALEAEHKVNQAVLATITGYRESFGELVDQTGTHLQETFQRLLVDVNQQYRDGVKGHIDQTHRHLEELLREHATKLQSFSNMLLDLHLDGRAVHAA